MSITPNLVFFNKEGYPYNFRLNDGIWTGKIFFEPGSTDIFKSLTMYTLENVEPIEFIGECDIENREIYNDSGMTLSGAKYTNPYVVSDVLTVNQSPAFFTKWVYGTNFHRMYPKGTVVSFTSDYPLTGATGEHDFSSGYYFTVLQTANNAFMISTTTSNDMFSYIYDSSLNQFYVNAYACIAVPDADQNLSGSTGFDINTDQKVSVIGSFDGDNDGVYEVYNTGYTMSRVFDFNLSGITNPGDLINVNLTLLTERPLLYNGQFIMEWDGSTYYATFVGGRNSNVGVGTMFICEDSAWNHILLSNEYTIDSIITENFIATPTGITFSGYTYEEDDGTMESVYILRMLDTFGIQVGWNLRFDSVGMSNNSLVKSVTIIESGITYVLEWIFVFEACLYGIAAG